jgi:hypothetical protein
LAWGSGFFGLQRILTKALFGEEEKLNEKGALYKPALKLQEKLATPPLSRVAASLQNISKSEKKETETEKSKRLQQEKKKSNLETFKEELKRYATRSCVSFSSESNFLIKTARRKRRTTSQ